MISSQIRVQRSESSMLNSYGLLSCPILTPLCGLQGVPSSLLCLQYISGKNVSNFQQNVAFHIFLTNVSGSMDFFHHVGMTQTFTGILFMKTFAVFLTILLLLKCKITLIFLFLFSLQFYKPK